MAGGTWTAQNKIRPGAYINFKAVSNQNSNIGVRGVMTMPVAMSWGPQKGIIELYSTDLANEKSLDKIGLYGTDSESLIFRQALSNCYKAYIFRLDVGGTKASYTISGSDLVVSAKYFGTSGNNVSFSFKTNVADSTKYDVITYFRGIEKDRQVIDKAGEVTQLESNDWITWGTTGDVPVNDIATTALTGGTNGTVSTAAYTDYINDIKAYTWNTMAIPQSDDIVTDNLKTTIISAIRSLREDEGKKVQVVLHNATTNYEGVICTRQGYKTKDEVISVYMFTAYMAGLTAGSEINISNTYRPIEGAVEIVYEAGVTPYDHHTVISELSNGRIVLSTRQDGAIVIEQDINTLHSPYPSSDVNYVFSKNRVIRTLDDINTAITNSFEKTYIGKMSNSVDGRNLFKADIISYLNKLQSINAINNFDSATDIVVEAGESLDSVVVNLSIQPIDSMEKLYMTVRVY